MRREGPKRTEPTTVLSEIDLLNASEYPHAMSSISPLRSSCPINALVEAIGDPWSLLILRDVVLRRSSRYSEFQRSDEGIATNILADRLKKLVHRGFLERRPDPGDNRSSLFLPTDRTLDLIPVMLAAMAWGARHEPTANVHAGVVVAYLADPLGTAERIAAGIRWGREGPTT